MIPDPMEEPTLSVERAGRVVGLGRSAAYEAVGRGEIPTIRFGRRVVVPTAALLRLLGFDPPVREEGHPRGDDGIPADAISAASRGLLRSIDAHVGGEPG